MEELGIAMLDDAEWTSLEKAVDALEESWQTSGEADLTQLVPPPDDPLYSQALVQLIKIDQEYRYRAGFPKPLEAYLDEWPGLTTDPDLTAELLATECQTRIIVDTPPNDQELRTRFPVIAARIDLAEIAARVERESRSTTDIKEAEETGLKAIVGPIWPVEQPPARYQIREVLGRGGMGTVYRAYDTQLDREVALKVPCIDLGDDPAVRERFFREAKAVARISHPNVCQVFDAGESGGGYYIAMALIEGQSLAARLQQGSLDCRQAAELVCKLARALGVVHAGGIIHRDLKPQNVMLDTQGEPLLTDFGLARPVQADGHLTGTYSLLGTPAYMSPEQMHGDPAGTTSDIYALGVILYQVLTGRLPFSGPPAQLPLNIVRGNPPRPRKLRPEVDPGLEAICLKAMAKRPGDRFQTAEEMAEALQRYLDGPPQPAGPPRRIRRLARLAGAGAAAILLLAVIIHLKTEKGTLVLEVGPPDVKVTIDGNQVHIKSPRDEISVRIGDHKLEVSKDGLETRTESFTIRRGGRTEIVARLEPAPPRPADGSTSQDLNWQQTLACPRDWCSQWDGSVTSWNGSIYFIGSKPYGGTPHEGLSWRGDVAADGQVVAWSRVSTSPVARFDGQGVVAANGYIYNVGGESRGYVPTSSVEYAPINVDGTLGEWRTTSALARPVAGAALSAWGNRLYFFGGWGSGRRFSLTAQYAEILTDGSLGPWIDDDSIMNAGHPHGGGVAHDGYLYAIAGGLGSPDTAIVERAAILPDGSLGQWTVDTPLPVACHAFGADIVGDTIFVVAGDVGGVVTS